MIPDEVVEQACRAAYSGWPSWPNAYDKRRAMRAGLEAVWPEPTLTREDADVLLAALSGSSYWQKLEIARRKVKAVRDA